jgi:hypothetical protein
MLAIVITNAAMTKLGYILSKINLNFLSTKWINSVVELLYSEMELFQELFPPASGDEGLLAIVSARRENFIFQDAAAFCPFA